MADGQRLVIRLAGLCAESWGHPALSAHYLCALGFATLPWIASVPALQDVELDLTDPRAMNELAELQRALNTAGIPVDRFQDRCLTEFDPHSWSTPAHGWAPPRPHTKTMPMLDVMISQANADSTSERREGRAVPRPVHLLTALLSSPDLQVSVMLRDVGVARESALARLRDPDASW